MLLRLVRCRFLDGFEDCPLECDAVDFVMHVATFRGNLRVKTYIRECTFQQIVGTFLKKLTHDAISNKIIGSRPYSPGLEDQKPDWSCKSLFEHHKQISYFPREPIIA